MNFCSADTRQRRAAGEKFQDYAADSESCLFLTPIETKQLSSFSYMDFPCP